jgi:hypothetical protein
MIAQTKHFGRSAKRNLSLKCLLEKKTSFGGFATYQSLTGNNMLRLNIQGSLGVHPVPVEKYAPRKQPQPTGCLKPKS